MAFVRRHLRKVKPRVLEANKDGKIVKLWKRCDVKVIVQDKVQPHKFVAPAGNGYSEEDIENIRERVIDYLDKRFPHFEFKEVPVAPNAFNYIATGIRGGQSTQEFMNEQAKRFDPEAFVASVRARAGGDPESGGADGGDKSDDKDCGAAPAVPAGSTEDHGGSNAAATEYESTDSREPEAGRDSERSMPESGPQHPRDPESPDRAI